MKENLYEIIIDFSKEKGLDHEVVKKLVEQSLIQAAQRKLPYREIEGQIDENTGNINLYHFKNYLVLEGRRLSRSYLQYHIVKINNRL